MSSPRSRAKWLRVPYGMTTKGRSRSTATEATLATVPSPPAAPSTSASAERASSTTSSPSASRRTSIPRERAAAASSSALGLSVPAPGLISRTPVTGRTV